MPRIREYNRHVETQGPVAGPRVTGEDFSGGQDFGQLGSAIAHSASKILDVQDRENNYEAQKTYQKSKSYWMEWFAKIEDPASPEEEAVVNKLSSTRGAFTDHFKKEFESWRSKTLENAGDSSDYLDAHFEGLNGQLLEKAMGVDAQIRGRVQKRDYLELDSQNKNLLRADPSKLPEVLKDQTALIDASPYWNNQQKEQMRTQARVEFWDTAVDATVGKAETSTTITPEGVQGLIKQMKDEKVGWLKNNSPKAYDNALDRLERLGETLKKKKEQEVYLDFDEKMDQIEVTGVDNGQYTAGWIAGNVRDPIKREQMLKREMRARAIGKEVSWIKDAPDTEIAERLDPAKVQAKLAGTPEFHKEMGAVQAASQAYARRAQAWEDDKVGYTLGVSSVAKKQYDMFAENPSPETAKQYAETVLVEQRRLSPGSTPSILNDNQVAQVATQLAAVTSDPQGAAKAVEILQNNAALWGKHWPVAVKDLKAGKAINDSQYVAAGMFDNPRVKHIAEDLVRASLVKEEDLVKGLPAGETTKKTVHEKVLEQLEPLRKTLESMADGREIFTSYQNALTQLSLYKGGDVNAVAGYAEKVVLDNYYFEDTYRIPRSQDKGAVNDAVEKIQDDLGTYEFASVPQDLVGLKPEDAKKRYVDNLKKFGRIVNNNDNGLRFVDEHGRQVWVNQGGKKVPLQWNWGELKALTAPPVEGTK